MLFHTISFESDIEILVKRVMGGDEEHKTYFGNITMSIKLLSLSFNACHFLFNKRQENSVVHDLTQLALQKPNRVGLEEVHEPINVYYDLIDD